MYMEAFDKTDCSKGDQEIKRMKTSKRKHEYKASTHLQGLPSILFVGHSCHCVCILKVINVPSNHLQPTNLKTSLLYPSLEGWIAAYSASIAKVDANSEFIAAAKARRKHALDAVKICDVREKHR